MKKVMILSILLGLTVSEAFSQQASPSAEKTPPITITEGEIPPSLKDNELRIALDLMMSNRGRVYFEYNSAAISAKAKTTLRLLAEYMDKKPELNLELEGRSADLAKEKGNCSLAAKRADNVKDFLSNQGVSPNRIQAYGSCGPINEGNSPAGSESNFQRVEFFLR